jgi:hypothetical protein
MSAPRPRDQAELANLLSEIALLWPDLSQREIARRLNLKAGTVSGLVARARAHGDRRFSSRPDPTPKVRVVKPAGEEVGNRRRVPPPAPPKPRLLIDLGGADCRWPVGEVNGRHVFSASLRRAAARIVSSIMTLLRGSALRPRRLLRLARQARLDDFLDDVRGRAVLRPRRRFEPSAELPAHDTERM